MIDRTALVVCTTVRHHLLERWPVGHGRNDSSSGWTLTSWPPSCPQAPLRDPGAWVQCGEPRKMRPSAPLTTSPTWASQCLEPPAVLLQRLLTRPHALTWLSLTHGPSARALQHSAAGTPTARANLPSAQQNVRVTSAACTHDLQRITCLLRTPREFHQPCPCGTHTTTFGFERHSF